MNRTSWIAENEDDTDELGRRLAELLPERAVVALSGTLGAGKTRLVRAVAIACGVDPTVVCSPTFVIVHEYQGDRNVNHFDAYRLRDEDEFIDIGPEEYFSRPGISLVEWAERVEGCLPRERLEITIEILSETRRQFEIRDVGGAHGGLIEKLAARDD